MTEPDQLALVETMMGIGAYDAVLEYRQAIEPTPHALCEFLLDGIPHTFHLVGNDCEPIPFTSEVLSMLRPALKRYVRRIQASRTASSKIVRMNEKTLVWATPGRRGALPAVNLRKRSEYWRVLTHPDHACIIDDQTYWLCVSSNI